MERKSFASSGQSYGLNRATPAHRDNCGKILQFAGRSTIPRLPPIVQHDVQVPTSVTKTVLSEKYSQRDVVCSSKQQSGSDILPRLERTPFQATAHFTLEKRVQESSPSNHRKRYERPELSRTQEPLNLTREAYTKKQEISAISDGFLRGRRKKKDRLSSYKCTNTEIIDDEISGFERRVGFDVLSTTSPKCVKDMKGRLIRSSDVYGEGVSSLLNILDNEEDEKSKKTSKKDGTETDDTPTVPEPSNPVRQRFLKALDTHFYNEYLNAQSGRRMAICEELEKLISGDGKTSLNGLREHLRLQDVLDSWVL
jgi:hypothetical protein